MNIEKSNNSISESGSEPDAPQVDVALAASVELIQDVQTPAETTYDNFIWILNYTKMYAIRLGRDLFESIRRYIYPETVLPDHIRDLMQVQSDLSKERELHSATYSSSPTIFRKELSESSLDVFIPSYPGSPRSIYAQSEASIPSIERGTRLREAVDFLHRDNELLVAAEIGNDRMLEKIIRARTDLQQMDHLGRNALHLAVCSGNLRSIEMLIKAGVNTNVKDNLGMTPLSLCLMRRPSMRVANLLFDYGATLIPRTDPMDTEFVMMCLPTAEEASILNLLVEKGACVNDPEAPGGRQALHFAAMSDNCHLINILMDLGADLYSINHRGETPRDVALTFKCKNAQALLEELEMELDSSTTHTTIAGIADGITF